MKYVADTNTFLAVALERPEKTWLVEVTKGCELIAPAVLPFEVGNALSGLARRKIIDADQAADAWDTVAGMPVEYADVDVRAALILAVQQGIYAYDAYYLQCSLETRCPLLTLDAGMKRIARDLNIFLVEPK